MSQSRRVLIRVIGAPLLLAALALIFYLDYRLARPLGVTVLAGLFAVLSYRELCAMARLRGLSPAEDVGALALSLVFTLLFVLWWREGVAVPVTLVPVAYVVMLLLLLVFRYGRFSPADAGYSTLAWGYVALLSFVLVPPPYLGGSLMWAYMLFLVATNKGSDMAAYVFGKLLGRHKMAPVVSPNKTWEGAIAGLVVGAGLGTILLERSVLKPLGAPPTWALALVAVAVTVAAQAGDLVKSAIKRWAGVKDSGRILPEFGGALDMCDSFILSAPVAWAALQVL